MLLYFFAYGQEHVRGHTESSLEVVFVIDWLRGKVVVVEALVTLHSTLISLFFWMILRMLGIDRFLRRKVNWVDGLIIFGGEGLLVEEEVESVIGHFVDWIENEVKWYLLGNFDECGQSV